MFCEKEMENKLGGNSFVSILDIVQKNKRFIYLFFIINLLLR